MSHFNNGLPPSSAADPRENDIVANCTEKLKQAKQEYEAETAKPIDLIKNTNIDPEGANGQLDAAKTNINGVAKNIKNRIVSQKEELRTNRNALRDYGIATQRNDSPQIFTWVLYCYLAIPGVSIETLMNGWGLFLGEADGFYITLAVSALLSCVNFGGGTLVAQCLAYAKKINTPNAFLRRLSAMGSILIGLIIVVANLALLMFGQNPDLSTNEHIHNLMTLNVSSKSWLIFGFGLLMATLSAWHWENCNDPDRRYGAMGKKVQNLEQEIANLNLSLTQYAEETQTETHEIWSALDNSCAEEAAGADVAAYAITCSHSDYMHDRGRIIAEGNAAKAHHRQIVRSSQQSSIGLPKYLTEDPNVEAELPASPDVKEHQLKAAQENQNFLTLQLNIAKAQKGLASHIDKTLNAISAITEEGDPPAPATPTDNIIDMKEQINDSLQNNAA